VSGVDLDSLVNVADFERVAAERLGAGPLGYYAGGAGDERTLRENVAAFERYRLWPRVLVDVSAVTTRTTVLGREIEMPVIVAPVAFQKVAHPDGEAGMARAAAAAGTIMCLSSIATTGPADVAAAAPGAARWFQLYCFRDRGVTRALLDEAVAHGFEAIALTVDAPRAGRRERDFRTGFRVDATAPAVAAAVGSDAVLTPAEIFGLVDPALDWEDLERLASECELPVLVKGLVRGDDAERAVEHGAAGVVVSNHGGRQLDSAPATIDALSEVVEAVGDRVDVLMDGGVRRGTDVVTALALGAKAVLVGRPALWGLAVAGEAGAARVLELLREEVELALVLCGAASPAALTADLVRPGPALGGS
jgi:isopentenyl diphosphate isomerase/L-lactate dehydrogenase-like FMN-dependent dehydrogenase